METHNLIHGCTAKSHRVFIPQIRLFHERKKFDIRKRLYVLRPDPLLVAAFAEERNAIVCVLHSRLETMELKFAQQRNRHEVHS